MRKIYILVGAISLLVFILFCWFFIFNFYEFAEDLGENSELIGTEEKSRFIGTWETEYDVGNEILIGYNGIYIFYSDGTSSVGGLSSTWILIDGQLKISYNQGVSSITYDYIFSEDENTLSLGNSEGSLKFYRRE